MSQNNDPDLDPFAPWRQLRDASMDTWAKSMAEAVNTEAFAQNLGSYLNTYLATSAPMQKFVEQYMEATLARLSMPSRDEVIDLARRMTSIETRLDDLDAKLDTILRGLSAPPPAQSSPETDARLRAIEERAERLLSAVEGLAARPSVPQPEASVDTPKPAASKPAASKPAASKPAASKPAGRGRTKAAKVEAPPAAEKSAADVAEDTAVEPFENANA
jgi:hypothetical protein